MTESYNPIMRTFCRLRAGLLDHLDIPRHEIRPDTPLETLLPVERRRQLWQHLRSRGLRLPDLQLSEEDSRHYFWGVVRAVISTAVGFRRWSALLLIFPFWLIAYLVSRPRAVRFPPGLSSVGELVIYATRFSEHRGSGYRWTRNEIALKVRLLVAEATGLPLEAIQPETNFAELLAC